MIKNRNLALITGATSGIGLATAHIFAQNGMDLILCGRREERLQNLKEEFSAQYQNKVHILSFDIKDKKKVEDALNSLSLPLRAIDILINNAGNAHGLSSFEESDYRDFEEMIDVNVKGVYYLSKIVTPWMIERKKGHIVNIGSIAGKEVYPNGNGYCASKFAVDALTKGMRIDLLKYGIKVSAIHPGQ